MPDPRQQDHSLGVNQLTNFLVHEACYFVSVLFIHVTY